MGKEERVGLHPPSQWRSLGLVIKLHGKPPSGLKQRVTSLKISDGSGAPEDWVGRTHGRKGSI